MSRTVKYVPIYFRKRNGEEPVRDEINSLTQKDQDLIKSHISVVSNNFPNVPKRGILKKMRGYEDIWEIRIKLDKRNVRILFLDNHSRSEIVLLHFFFKKSGKTPRNALKLAVSRKNLYLSYVGD